jgi:hypothetical protein
MKTPHLLITLGVAAFATLNVMAADALLSPRAADNQIKIVAGVNNDPNLTATGLASASPRLIDNRVTTVAGASTAVSPSLTCTRKMAGTPKMIGACAEHPGAPMSCCSVAAGK